MRGIEGVGVIALRALLGRDEEGLQGGDGVGGVLMWNHSTAACPARLMDPSPAEVCRQREQALLAFFRVKTER